MLPIATLGTPRIGPRRELKLALERYWSGKNDENALLTTAAALRAANWARQKALGVTVIPSNDFSLYDHVLDTSVMVGAIPPHYGWTGGTVSLETYFAMARGSNGGPGQPAHDHVGQGHSSCAAAQEMTKWFDTNYHYMVPELARRRLSDRQIWINPDCGLKTRTWEEVKPALANMVEAAQRIRQLA